MTLHDAERIEDRQDADSITDTELDYEDRRARESGCPRCETPFEPCAEWLDVLTCLKCGETVDLAERVRERREAAWERVGARY